jgi:hypothetical protein
MPLLTELFAACIVVAIKILLLRSHVIAPLNQRDTFTAFPAFPALPALPAFPALLMGQHLECMSP